MIGSRDQTNDLNVVTGTFPVNNAYTSILFDSGVDISFINPKFRKLLNHKSNRLNKNYVVEMAIVQPEVPKKCYRIV